MDLKSEFKRLKDLLDSITVLIEKKKINRVELFKKLSKLKKKIEDLLEFVSFEWD